MFSVEFIETICEMNKGCYQKYPKNQKIYEIGAVPLIITIVILLIHHIYTALKFAVSDI